MTPPPYLKNLDFYLALTLLCLSSWGAFLTYTELASQEGQDALIEHRLKPGAEKLFIRSGAACVGEIGIQLKPEQDGFELLVDGQLHTLVSGSEVVGTISLGATFDFVGHLVGLLALVKAPPTEWKIQFLNPDPIEVSLSASGIAEVRNYTFTIPGPIQLRRDQRASYYLYYPRLRSEHESIAKGFLAGMLTGLPLEIVSASEKDETCVPFRPLNIQPIFEAVQRNFGALQGLMQRIERIHATP